MVTYADPANLEEAVRDNPTLADIFKYAHQNELVMSAEAVETALQNGFTIDAMFVDYAVVREKEGFYEGGGERAYIHPVGSSVVYYFG